MTGERSPSDVPDIRRFEKFIYDEVKLLDQRHFEDWMALFDDDAYYWAPSTPDQNDPYNHVSLFFDDKATMATRLTRLRHPRIHVQTPPSRTVHMVSNVVIEDQEAGSVEYLVGCNFLVLEYRPGHEQRTYGGSDQYRLRANDDAFRIAWKRANLVNCDATFPALALPF